MKKIWILLQGSKEKDYSEGDKKDKEGSGDEKKSGGTYLCVDLCSCRVYHKKHSAREEKPPFKLLGRIFQEALKITKGLLHSPSFSPRIGGKTLLVILGHTSETRFRII